MQQTARFWNRIADRYARQPVADEASYQQKLQMTREHLRPDMELLEIGCGTGSTAIVHAPRVKHILALDVSPRMLEIAQGKAEAQQVRNITFQCGNIDDFRAPDGAFDMVLALSILHLLADRDAALARVHAMLKPGGLLVSSTACLGDSMKFIGLIAPLGHRLGLIPLVKVFTRDELKASMVNAGFAIERDWQPGRNKAVFIMARKRV